MRRMVCCGPDILYPQPTSYTQAASPAARPTLPTAGATSISA